jgi:DNA-binding HxlR family transcriptional regulator
MIKYGQFCPVAKTAEVFADRWSPLIVRELCYGAKTFGELLSAMPLISRTVLAQRLRELAHAGAVQIDPKQKGRGHFYRLTAAGEDFRPLIMLMSEWGQRWGRESIGRDDLDPQLLMWAARADRPDGRSAAGIRRSLRVPRPAESPSELALLVAGDAARRHRDLHQGSRIACRLLELPDAPQLKRFSFVTNPQ